jgi:hypothetical protein
MSNAPTVGGYSFYLNVVVINSGGRDDGTVSTVSQDEFAQTEAPGAPPKEEEEAANAATATDSNGAIVAVGPVTDAKTNDPKLKLLAEGRSLVDSVFSKNSLKRGSGKSNDSNPNKFVQDGQRFRNSIGSSITQSSSNISKRASRYMASKTMVSRAEKAVAECIPLITEEIGVEMSISKRFQQGPVFVLEVDMKGCDLLDLLEKVLGEECAQHYRNVKEGLDVLGLPDTQDAFVQEILPKVRQAMSARMSEIVPEKMKQKKAYADLEIQCVALEDAEEAKWLYNFLAFMEEMK